MKIKNIFVKIFLFYLRTLAKFQLAKTKPYIIGVGGASGKTSLSNFIYLILNKKYKVKQGKGKNSETGIPLDILGLKIKNYTFLDWLKVSILALFKAIFDFRKLDIYIAEMGIDSPLEPKNMTYLLKIIKPDVGVLTNISYEHSQYFDPLIEGVTGEERQEDILDLTAKEEGLLLSSLDRESIAIMNMDDEKIASLEPSLISKKISVSSRLKSADFYIEKIQNFIDRFLVVFIYDSKEYKIQIPNPLPKHFAYSFVLAIASAMTKEISIDEAISTLQSDFSLPPGRMTVFKGKKDTVLIDSSYNNATLTPILDLLDFVLEIGKQRRRIGIIGDMRELGTMSKALHEEVAQKILKTLDAVILVGPLMEKYVEPILKKNKFESFSYLSFSQAKDKILEIVKPKDVILVKGSQNTLFLERAVEMLLQNLADSSKLCRRGEFWDKIRAKTL